VRGNDTVQALMQQLQDKQQLQYQIWQDAKKATTANCKSPKKEASQEFPPDASKDQGNPEPSLTALEQSNLPSVNKAPPGPTVRKSVSALDISELEIQTTSMLSFGVGFSGKRKLLQYDFNKLQAFGAIPAAFAECSIFRLRRSLLFQVLLQPFFVLAVFGMAKLAADDDPAKLRSQLLPVLSVPERLRQLVAFLLGLFVALQLKRWWSIRSVYLQSYFFCYCITLLVSGCCFARGLRRATTAGRALLSHGSQDNIFLRQGGAPPYASLAR